MPTHGAVEDYVEDELVVSLSHKDLVSKALDDLYIGHEDTDSSEPLGLALLGLDKDSLGKAAGQLRSDSALVERAKQAKWPGGEPDGIPLRDIDLLLSKLRWEFSARYAGWIPEIGKNRMISPVRGLPYVSGCTLGNPHELGLDDPALPGLTSGESPVWRQPRPTEPGHGVRVGLLDTQIYPHEWLAGGYLATKDDLLPDPPSDGEPLQALAGHGTFIAGLILQQAPGARLIVRPVMGQRAEGKTWGVAKVMAEFAGTGVDILNLSFGCYTDDGQPPLVLAKAVSLLSQEIVLVAAAGNHGDIEELRAEGSPLAADWTKHLKDTTPVWPAAFDEVTAVGATGPGGEPAPFSPKAPWVDITAPGVDVESTYLKGNVRLSNPPGKPEVLEFDGFARWQGTSFAAGSVSGAVAARIGPGRDARQALQAVRNRLDSGIGR